MACTKSVVSPCTAFSLVLGSIFLAVGFVIRSAYQPYNNGVQTEGTISRVQVSRGSLTLYATVFAFETEDGEMIEKTSKCRSSYHPRVGATVRVSYRPSHPYGARNLDNVCNKVVSLIFLCMGGVMLLVAIYTALSTYCSKVRELVSHQNHHAHIHETDEKEDTGEEAPRR